MASPSDVLQLDAGADAEEIRRAFRQRVLEAHPDHGGSAEELQRVLAAYRELADGEPPPSGTTGPFVEEWRVEYLNYEALDDHGWRLDDPDLFRKAAAEEFDPRDHGRLVAEPEGSLLEAAETHGHAWPFACRGGACANCAVAVTQGELAQPPNHILPPELLADGFRLSCCGVPITERLQVVFNVKHLPSLDELRLPPYPFERSRRGG